MYVVSLSWVVLILQLFPPVVPASSPALITREEGDDMVFMFNVSANILEVFWGIRDGDTSNFKLQLIAVDKSGVQLSSNAGYAGRISFVGNITKGQAWFKTTNLNINDTNQYMAQIYMQGGIPGQYNYTFTKLIVMKRVLISGAGSLTREVGEDVVFMVNGTAMSEATWGIRDDDTNYLNPRLYRVFNPGGAFPDTQINSTGYAGRVSFVGDLSKGQAWFKITNLNINDTNQYMMKILLLEESSYRYITTRLTVVHSISTRPLQTSTPENTSAASSSPTSLRPTTSRAPRLSNRSVSIKVVREVRGDLSDPNSTAFRTFSENFVSEINSVYKTDENFEKAKVTSLSENSIPVKFVVYFKNTTKLDEICAPLQNAVKDNRLGSLKMVPGSLGCSNEPSQGFPKNQSSSACNCTSIIAACVTIIILLILAVVVLLIYIWRSRSNTGKGAGSRRSTSIQEKNLEAYENASSLKNTSVAIPSQTPRKPNPEKELYATIHESGDKDKDKTAKPVRGSSAGTEGDVSLPQHYQELQRKAPNPTPLYEPLKQRDVDIKGEGPQTYEQLQQSASGGEYQSLSKRYEDTESKV